MISESARRSSEQLEALEVEGTETNRQGDDQLDEIRAEKGTWLLRDIIEAPSAVLQYYRRLSEAFGWRFVAIVSIVYGVNQAIGEEFYSTGSTYFFSDKAPSGLDLEADRAASINGFANVPWQIKSIYGIASDTFPINGLHRTPYIVISGVIGVASFAGLWLLPVLTVGLVAVLLFFGNLSIASPDVMIDASVAEKCKSHPQLASDLQTLCWSSFGIGKIFSAASAGWLYHQDWCGSRGLFGLVLVTSIVMLIPALKGYLSERVSDQSFRAVPTDANADVTGPSRSLPLSFWERMSGAFQDPLTGPLYRLSIFVLVTSVTVGVLVESSENDLLIFTLAVLAAGAVSIAVYKLECGISVRLAKASVFIFLSGAMQPSSSLLFYWSRENKENCAPERMRPCFSPEFLSTLGVVGYFVFVIGTSMYNKYLTSWTYKRIWTSTQVLLCLIGLLDYVLVMRWNVALGIPDKAFMIGDEVLGDLVRRMNTMPLFVLAAATCPPGVEATLFAMNMGLSNFGGTLGSYTGIGIMWALGGVKSPEYENLATFVVIRSLFRLLPVVLIPFFVPNGTPNSEEEESNEDRSCSVTEETLFSGAKQLTEQDLLISHNRLDTCLQ